MGDIDTIIIYWFYMLVCDMCLHEACKHLQHNTTFLCEAHVAQRLPICTDRVQCRESAAGIGPVVLKVHRVTELCWLLKYHHGPINMRLSFPTPTINWYVMDNMCYTESTRGKITVGASSATVSDQQSRTGKYAIKQRERDS